MPAVARILIVFASMLLVTRVRVPLGLALVAGGLALTLWAGLTVTETLGALGHAVTRADLWLLVAITVLIIEIGRFMTEGRNAEEIVTATRRWGGRHGEAVSLMALPAMIGLVPMPGGALFSAPFVARSGERASGGPDWKSGVNYWFRHVWEYWWPLYPGVIVAMSLFEMDAWKFMATQFLFTPVALTAGYVFLVRPHVSSLKVREGNTAGVSRRALFLFTPVMIVVASVLVLPPVLRRLCPDMSIQTAKLLGALAGLLTAVCIVAVDDLRERIGRKAPDGAGEPGPRALLFSSLFKRKSINVLTALAGVLIFKSMLETSGLLPQASREFSASGIPLVCVIAALPLLAGFVTGLAVGFAGAAFPLVVGLLATEGSGLTPLATLVLAYGFGYMGMMLSPVHLCLLVTKEYFSSELIPIYRRIAPCVLTVLLYCLAAYAVLAALNL